jgi:hypothetical protein
MHSNSKVSRRTLISVLTVAPTLSTGATAGPMDAELIRLERELEATGTALNRASQHNEAMVLLDRIETLSAAIVAIPAKSLDGLRIKARATAWALENDCDSLDPMKESTINGRLAASIVRDLLFMTSRPSR